MMNFLRKTQVLVIASHALALSGEAIPNYVMGLLRRDFVTPRNDGGMRND
jgi:hypothetical protein